MVPPTISGVPPRVVARFSRSAPVGRAAAIERMGIARASAKLRIGAIAKVRWYRVVQC